MTYPQKWISAKLAVGYVMRAEGCDHREALRQLEAARFDGELRVIAQNRFDPWRADTVVFGADLRRLWPLALAAPAPGGPRPSADQERPIAEVRGVQSGAEPCDPQIKPTLAWDEGMPAEGERWASNQEATTPSQARADAAVVVASTPPRSSSRPRVPDSMVQAWYEKYVKEHLREGTATSEEDDWTAAREKFGDRVRQDQIRKLRRDFVPKAWRKQGRRPKRALAPSKFRQNNSVRKNS